MTKRINVKNISDRMELRHRKNKNHNIPFPNKVKNQ